MLLYALFLILQKKSESEDEIPFIVLNEENKLVLLPLVLIHKEAPSSEHPFPWTDILHATSEIDCPLEKWFHVGCQVSVTANFSYISECSQSEIFFLYACIIYYLE